MKNSDMLNSFGQSVFTTLAQMRNERQGRGEAVYDFSIGSPNVPPAPHIIAAGAASLVLPESYKYSLMDSVALKQAVTSWYERRYAVTLDPMSEVSSLLGSQEGLTHINMALTNRGDTVLVPDPCYPAFADGAKIWQTDLQYMPMKAETGYLLQLRDIPTEVAKRAKMMIVSYPNNPTAALAPDEFYHEVIAFARENDIIILHDNAYSDLVYDGLEVGSFLRFEGAKDLGVEFNSLSKTYGLAGARVGFCVGNADVVAAVKKLKSNMDYGMFMPVQQMAIAAITGDQTCVKETCAVYERRRDVLCECLNSLGWKVEKPKSTMFAWTRIPEGFENSLDFVTKLFEQTGVLMTPGSAFGPSGEGFVRMALVQSEATIKAAAESMKASGLFNK